ncbi:MAG: hypothetical protein CVU65_12210 [Deltaproteobacteria bacterium HGW-Deltaproteobacteria-22]|nr:MAG: hypothetical protein CVU65_12210 [Deltaproteobacteria bacterium HGW-Deltaproteobacteria-22]
MRRSYTGILFVLFLTALGAPARAAEPVGSDKPAEAQRPTNSLLFEGGGGLNACSGDFCTEGGPSWGVDLTGLYRMHRNFGLGFNVHYGRMAPDKLDTMYYYVLNFEARGILPLGSRLALFASGNFGYMTTYVDGTFEDQDNKFLIFRATGVTVGATAGFTVRVSERFHVGVMGRFWLPNWSDACFYEADGGECREPQDSEIDLDMKPWYAGFFVQYELPY